MVAALCAREAHSRVNRGTLSNFYGLQVFQDKYFEHFIHQFYFEKENHLLERTKI